MRAQRLKTRAGPAGLQLFNRRNGFTILLDEVSVPAHQWSSAPRHVSIALTNACDLQCRHCFVPRTADFLDPQRVAEWLVELDANGCVSVGFGGGEPTLHPDFSELCRFAAAKTRLGVTCTTHGFGFGEHLLASVSGALHFTRISMDGVGPTYEAIRGKSFQSLCQIIQTARNLFPFGINYLVNSLTFPDLDAAVSVASTLGASQFLLLPEQPVGGAGGIDGRTARELRRWVSSYRGNVPLAVSEFGSDGLPTCDPLAGENGLRAYAHIDAKGTLKASSFDTTGNTIGTGGFVCALDELSSKGGVNCEDLE